MPDGKTKENVKGKNMLRMQDNKKLHEREASDWKTTTKEIKR